MGKGLHCVELAALLLLWEIMCPVDLRAAVPLQVLAWLGGSPTSHPAAMVWHSGICSGLCAASLGL